MGAYSLTKIDHLKSTSNFQHIARLSSNTFENENNQTASELSLPEGSHPIKVKGWIYLDHIASISIANNTWSPVFYLWFKCTDDTINPGNNFNIIGGVRGEALGSPDLLQCKA